MNLEIRDGRLALSCTRGDWPRPATSGASFTLVVATLPLLAIAAYVLVAFVGWHVPDVTPLQSVCPAGGTPT